MTNYITVVQGHFSNNLPWSFRQFWTGAISESTVAGTLQSAITNLVNGSSPTGIKALMTADVIWDSVYASTGSATWHQTTKTTENLTSVVGTDAGHSLPFRMCEVVRLKSNLANKQGRGRIHLPAFAQSACAGETFATGVGATLKAAFNNYMATMQAAGLQPVIFGTKTSKHGVAPYTLVNVTSQEYPEVFYSLRRRDHKQFPTLA